MQEYYVQSTNHYLNKHFFSINRHPKLQWLCATAVSPGLGIHKHQWIAPKKKEKGSNDLKKTLMELYPTMKIADIETLASVVDKKALRQHLKDHGTED
jgi:hypothetical protein